MCAALDVDNQLLNAPFAVNVQSNSDVSELKERIFEKLLPEHRPLGAVALTL
jgi:hypothetical protein